MGKMIESYNSNVPKTVSVSGRHTIVVDWAGRRAFLTYRCWSDGSAGWKERSFPTLEAALKFAEEDDTVMRIDCVRTTIMYVREDIE